MKILGRFFAATTLLAAGAALLTLPQFAASNSQDMAGMHHTSAADESTPAFHAQPPADALPATMEP